MIREILLSEAVLSFALGLLAALLYRLALLKLPSNYRRVVIDSFLFIEENYEEWGIFGSAKMAKLVQLFIDGIKKEFGISPTPEQVGSAVKLAEELVTKQKNSPSG